MEISKRKKPRKPCFLVWALVVASLLFAGSARAQSVSDDLIGLGMKPEQAEYLAGILPGGSVLGNGTYLKGRNQANSADINILRIDTNDDLVINSDSSDVVKIQIDSDANRLWTFDATSDTILLHTFGDGGTTAAQRGYIIASTSDADDDAQLALGGGGDIDSTRGAYFQIFGNEHATAPGEVNYITGRAAGSGADHEFYTDTGSGAVLRWSITADGRIVSNATNGGDLVFGGTGDTISVQEATPGSACMGVATPNGTTPVAVSTTCAVTGARVFFSRVGAITNMGTISVTTAPGGSGFSIASTGASDTLASSVVYLIVKESA